MLLMQHAVHPRVDRIGRIDKVTYFQKEVERADKVNLDGKKDCKIERANKVNLEKPSIFSMVALLKELTRLKKSGSIDIAG